MAGIRSVMEQIAQILKGVGDFGASTSDWEDLSGPVKMLADTLQAIAEIGKTVARKVWFELGGGSDPGQRFIASARAILTSLGPTLKGVGDFVSTSDWEDFTAPLKMLADSLSSISQISALFADEKSIPSLAGLAAPSVS